MSELPKRSLAELAEALRRRADFIQGERWEIPATVAMMREAADALASVDTEQRAAFEAGWRAGWQGNTKTREFYEGGYDFKFPEIEEAFIRYQQSRTGEKP